MEQETRGKVIASSWNQLSLPEGPVQDDHHYPGLAKHWHFDPHTIRDKKGVIKREDSRPDHNVRALKPRAFRKPAAHRWSILCGFKQPESQHQENTAGQDTGKALRNGQPRKPWRSRYSRWPGLTPLRAGSQPGITPALPMHEKMENLQLNSWLHCHLIQKHFMEKKRKPDRPHF